MSLAWSRSQARDPEIVFVRLDEATAEIFESQPPSPLDYAVFLIDLKEHRPRACAVVPLWQWPDADPTAVDVLAKQIIGLPFLLAAMLEEDVPAPELAASLEAFPKGSRLEGDASQLPRFTAVAALPNPRIDSYAGLGFVLIDLGADAHIDEDGIRVPLFALGPDEERVPSLALVTAVHALDLSWDQVLLLPGESIILGEEATPVLIDDAGYLLVSFDTGDSIASISGEAILSSGTAEGVTRIPKVEDATVILGDDREEAKLFTLPSGNRLSRAELTAWTVHALLQQSKKAPWEPPSAPPATGPAPPPEPAIKPASDQFPDLGTPNIGLWALGAVAALVLGSLLLQNKSAHREPPAKPQMALLPAPDSKGTPGKDQKKPSKRDTG